MVPSLDQSWLAWLATKTINNHFLHNYDRKNLFSGTAFTEVMGAIIGGLSGRKTIADYLVKALSEDPTKEHNLVARGLALNQDTLISDWVDGAQKAHVAGEKASVAGAVASIYAGWAALMGGRDPNAYRGIAKYAYHLAAPIIGTIDTAVGKAWLQGVPQKRLVTLMGTLAKMDNPSKILLDMHGTVTEAERVQILNRSIGKVLGKGAGAQSAASRFVRDKHITMDMLVLVDEDRLKTGKAGAVTARTMEEAMAETVPRLGRTVTNAGLSVVGFILAAVNCRTILGNLQTTHGAVFEREAINLLGQATGLTGAGFDATGSVLEAYSAKRLASGFETLALRSEGIGKWCTGAGRLLGGFGGIIVGAVAGWQGVVDYGEGHTALGVFEGIGGIFGIIAGGALLFGFVAVGFIVGLAAALVMLLIAYFKQNPIQNWIEKSKLGDGGLPQYKNPVEQVLALKGLTEG